jgi:hypothetical protein
VEPVGEVRPVGVRRGARTRQVEGFDDFEDFADDFFVSVDFDSVFFSLVVELEELSDLVSLFSLLALDARDEDGLSVL